jgi:hypothetical protein
MQRPKISFKPTVQGCTLEDRKLMASAHPHAAAVSAKYVYFNPTTPTPVITDPNTPIVKSGPLGSTTTSAGSTFVYFNPTSPTPIVGPDTPIVKSLPRASTSSPSQGAKFGAFAGKNGFSAANGLSAANNFAVPTATTAHAGKAVSRYLPKHHA